MGDGSTQLSILGKNGRLNFWSPFVRPITLGVYTQAFDQNNNEPKIVLSARVDEVFWKVGLARSNNGVSCTECVSKGGDNIKKGSDKGASLYVTPKLQCNLTFNFQIFLLAL